MTDRMPTPGHTYLSSPEAVSLHATFVDNVLARMRELGWMHAAITGTSAGGHKGRPGTPDFKRLAEASNVPYRTVENLMRKQNQPTMVGAANIARALGVRLDDLLGMSRDWGMAPRSDGPMQLTCIHISRHTPTLPVCPTCLSKWQSYQQRLNALYEANRHAVTDEWDADNKGIALTPQEKSRG